LDQPVNIHLTGCPNSCAQHYMGDIGCLGTRVKDGSESVDAYHVFVGGGFGSNQAVGRQVLAGVKATELPNVLEAMLRAYLKHREGRETFKQFATRHDVRQLQEFFDEVHKR
jgi:ferredoxin-nitrite reductase